MLQKRFEQCVQLLKDHSVDDIQHTKEVLKAQVSELESEQYEKGKTVRKLAHRASNQNDQFRERIQSIELNDIPELQRNLVMQQKQTIYSEAKKLTIAQIVRKKNEIVRYGRFIEENNLRVQQSVRVLKLIVDELEGLNNEIKMLEQTLLIASFLTLRNVDVQTIADFELPKYYQAFTSEVGENE